MELSLSFLLDYLVGVLNIALSNLILLDLSTEGKTNYLVVDTQAGFLSVVVMPFGFWAVLYFNTSTAGGPFFFFRLHKTSFDCA